MDSLILFGINAPRPTPATGRPGSARIGSLVDPFTVNQRPTFLATLPLFPSHETPSHYAPPLPHRGGSTLIGPHDKCRDSAGRSRQNRKHRIERQGWIVDVDRVSRL